MFLSIFSSSGVTFNTRHASLFSKFSIVQDSDSAGALFNFLSGGLVLSYLNKSGWANIGKLIIVISVNKKKNNQNQQKKPAN